MPTPPPLTLLTTYFNPTVNPWAEPNARYCTSHWRKAGAYVVLVELIVDDDPAAFHPTADAVHYVSSTSTALPLTPVDPPPAHPCVDVLVQLRVHDVMWYKEMALNVAKRYVPTECPLVGWIDNDVVFVPPATDATDTVTNAATRSPDWWVRAIADTFQRNPQVALVQPFQQVALTTENVRDGVVGRSCRDVVEEATDTQTVDDTQDNAQDDAQDNHTPPTLDYDDAVDRCEQMLRLRPCIMRDRTNGVTGGAWVARKCTLDAVPFFAQTYIGGGDDLTLNLLQNGADVRTFPVLNDMQRWYLQTYAKPLQRYRKRLQMRAQLPMRCAYLPCTLLHLYHGELATKKTHLERHHLLLHRRFHPSHHVRPHHEHTGLYEWTDAFRETGINAELRTSLERSHSAREKVLLKLAKMHKCMDEVRQHVHGAVQLDTACSAQVASAHAELSAMMRACLAAFDA